MPKTTTSLPSPYPALIIKYALLAVYGAASAWAGVTTLAITVGYHFAFLWPLLLTGAALGSLLGVIIEKRTGKHRVEVVATMAMLVLLAAYSIAEILRIRLDGNVEHLPVAVLPVIIAVYPYSRLWELVRKREGL